MLLVLGGCATSTASNTSAKGMTEIDMTEIDMNRYGSGGLQRYEQISDKTFVLTYVMKWFYCDSLGCEGNYSLNGLNLKLANQICVSEGQGVAAKWIAGSLTRNTDITFECLSEEENKLKKEKALAYAAEEKERELKLEELDLALEEERILAELELKKDKCRTYGFKDETDGMGMCLIELDKLAEIEKQTKSIEANSIAQTEGIAKQEAKEKKRREAQALINLGNALSGKGKASCSFKCSGGQVVQGSCQKVTVSVGSQTCWKQ